jgi:hypothetical protein
MSKWIHAGSSKVSLKADPNPIAASGQGKLQLDYEHHSFMPVIMNVLKLGSSNPHVATATPPPPPTINVQVPRRPHRHSARVPATGSILVGTWSSVNQGSATLSADVDIYDLSGSRLSAVTPSDDVQVT